MNRPIALSFPPWKTMMSPVRNDSSRSVKVVTSSTERTPISSFHPGKLQKPLKSKLELIKLLADKVNSTKEMYSLPSLSALSNTES
mmetsp:Transcript_50409/g.56242  ORF Transcript_50409/g.56242 Transcript_50409/m.56242 type:complete len:86 (+) Transcript_50409:874-1131(+)